MDTCVVCGQDLTTSAKPHRCPSRIEGAWAAQQTRALAEERGEYETNLTAESYRLWAGLLMWEHKDV